MRARIVSFIRSAVQAHGCCGAVIGISGGIDSTVVGALAVEALGRERVVGVLLPERDSAPDTMTDSLMVCEFLGIERVIKPIRAGLKAIGAYRLQPSTFMVPRKLQSLYVRKRIKFFGGDDVYLKDLKNQGDSAFNRGLAYYRVKHRMRMVCLYLEAEQRGFAVLGTTNRTEAATGFYVKWGDDSSDIEPILHLYKTQVYDLAREIGIPKKIQKKPPSPDLIPGVTDEQMLGITYRDLDTILMKMDQNSDMSGLEKEQVERVKCILAAAKKRRLKNLALAPEQNGKGSNGK